MNGLFSDLSPSSTKHHVKGHQCKCAKCTSQFNGDIVPKRKALCPVDKHLDEVIQMVLHTSLAPHKSCGCKACQHGIRKALEKDLAKMKPIKKIPRIKKLGKGKQAFGKKELMGKATYKWDRFCEHCVAEIPHDINTHKEGLRMGVGYGAVRKLLGNEDKLHKGLGI